MAELIFWFIAAFTIISAAFVVLNNQLIYSAVALLFTLFGVAGLYVFLWADFIAGVQLLVYSYDYFRNYANKSNFFRSFIPDKCSAGRRWCNSDLAVYPDFYGCVQNAMESNGYN